MRHRHVRRDLIVHIIVVIVGRTAHVLRAYPPVEAERVTPRLGAVHVDQTSVQPVDASERQLQTQCLVRRQVGESLLHVVRMAQRAIPTKHRPKLSARRHG